MNKVIGTIEKFGSERKTSKAGKAFNVYTVDVDGATYEVGFKPLSGFSPGDTISFMSEVKYGKNAMDPATVQRASGGSGSGSAASTGASTGVSARQAGGYAPRPFPIPKLHGDRAIVRQNSLTNAVKAVEVLVAQGALDGQFVSVDTAADIIIEMAYKFEAYSTGDREAEELEKRKGGAAGIPD